MVRYPTVSYGLQSIMRSIDRLIALEMVGLWLFECIFTTTVLCFLLGQDGHVLADIRQVDVSILQRSVICALTISLIAVAIGLYRADICLGRGKFMLTAGIAGTFLAPAIGGLTHVLGLDLDPQSPLTVLRILAGWVGCLVVTRIGFRIAQRLDWLARRVLVIGSSQNATRVESIITASGSSFCRVVGVVAPDAVASVGDVIKGRRLWSIVMADDSMASDCLAFPHGRGVQVFGEAGFRENRLQRLDVSNLSPEWAAVVEAASRRHPVDVVHRVADVAISLGFLLFTLPLMLVAALAIKLDSPGPVFYHQERVGRHGRVFMLRKFRSMRMDAETAGKPVWAAQDDPRVTRVGRIIRRTRVDELPQVLNVLSGEMSFIGPRPERPQFVEQLEAVVPHYVDRACVKPGITGWAQVKFPYGASVEDARMKLAYDLYYVKHRSLFFNLLIMVATVRVILFQEGSR